MPRWYYNLAISGCSYTQGEFSHVDDEYQITHRGLSYYLESDNYQTINVGQNGFSNRNAIKHLSHLKDMNVMHWLLVKTDPIRDLLYNQLDFIDENIDQNQYKMWLTWWDRHHDWNELADDYDTWLAQQIKKNFPGQDFWVVGGLCSLNPKPYQAMGIKVLWPSWTDQFTAEAADTQWDDVEWLIKNLPEQNKEQTVEIMDAVIKKNAVRYEHKWFATDGQHPDRNAHKMLYDKIETEIIREKKKKTRRGKKRIRILNGKPDISRKDYRTNKNLPKPKNKVIGPVRALPLSNALGIQMEITADDPDPNKIHEYWITIDNKTIYFGYDVSYTYKDLTPTEYKENDLYIGNAVIPNTHPIHKTFPDAHMQSPWNDSLWIQEIPAKNLPRLCTRQGWCCTMGESRLHRDAVADHITELLSHKPYNFVYDYPTEQQSHLKQYMFRDIPRQKSKEEGWKDGELQIWHYKRLVEICPETNYDIFYPSEKTWKPIAAQQLFVIIGCKHYLRRLRRMGFKTFHPYIDESYDNEDNMITRVDMAMKATQQFLDNADTLVDDLQPIVEHNKNRLIQLQKTNYYSHVAKKLKRYIKF